MIRKKRQGTVENGRKDEERTDGKADKDLRRI